MPLNSATKVYLNFVGGLVTEANPMAYPEGTCKDLDNVDLKRQGQIQRRLGLAFEDGGYYSEDTFTSEQASTYAVTKHEWRSVNGTGNLNFLVVQVGGTLYFYNLGSEPVSGSPIGKISFSSIRTSEDYALYPIDATSGRGRLFVVGRKISPFYIQYDEEANTFTGYKITVKIRDFEGIEEDEDLEVPIDEDEVTPDNTSYEGVLNQDIIDSIDDIDLTQLFLALGGPI